MSADETGRHASPESTQEQEPFVSPTLSRRDPAPDPAPTLPPTVPRRRPGGSVQDRVLRGLIEKGLVSDLAVDEAYLAAETDRRGGALFHLIETGRLTPDQVRDPLAHVLGVPAVNLADETPERRALEVLDSATARELKVLPLKITGASELIVAIADPFALHVMQRLRDLWQGGIEIFVADESSLARAIARAYGESGRLQQAVQERQRTTVSHRVTRAVGVELDAAVAEKEVPRLTQGFLEDAARSGASDIHFEFFAGTLRVRYRVDGQLQIIEELPDPDSSWGREIINHLKVRSHLQPNSLVPQDGRMRATMPDGEEVEFRVSTMPGSYGVEKAVLRLLARGDVVDLKALGMPPRERELFDRALGLSQGMILVTGPTGSGKSTTLYAALSYINDPSRNISTLEDPVERKIFGIHQTQINKSEERRNSLDWSRGLEALLRQDPDVIMVGEIRDKTTGQISVQASLTGHLLLSTLHTNDAVATVVRLSDLGIPGYLLADSLSLVVAQRLLRKLCPHCQRFDPPTEAQIERAGLTPEEAASIQFLHGKGCPMCSHTGYAGRRPVFEVLEMTPQMRHLVHHGASLDELRQQAEADGMRTLRQTGIELVRAGQTTLAEVIQKTVFA